MQEIYNKYMTIEMPDKSIWKVPVAIIANNHAEHYKHECGGDITETLKTCTLPLFEDDSYNIEDWAANNMNWSDVVAHAQMVKQGECDYQEGWCNGDKNIIA